MSSQLHVFDVLIERSRALGPVPVAVAAPMTEVALAGAVMAAKDKLIDPILVGPEQTLRLLAGRLDLDVGSFRLVDATDEADAARKSVALCRSGEARALMKGSLHTDVLMHAVLQHDVGLTTFRA